MHPLFTVDPFSRIAAEQAIVSRLGFNPLIGNPAINPILGLTNPLAINRFSLQNQLGFGCGLSPLTSLPFHSIPTLNPYAQIGVHGLGLGSLGHGLGLSGFPGLHPGLLAHHQLLDSGFGLQPAAANPILLEALLNRIHTAQILNASLHSPSGLGALAQGIVGAPGFTSPVMPYMSGLHPYSAMNHCLV